MAKAKKHDVWIDMTAMNDVTGSSAYLLYSYCHFLATRTL